jgi:segregation and condensation protein B
MNESYIKNVIEAALLAAGRPLTVAELAELFDETGRPGTSDIRAALASLEEDYTGRGIEVKETANGFRIQVRRDLANEISRLWPERPPRYSRAMLETLALIAYRQPITRAEIEAVRGVAVNPNIIKTMLERNWVRVVGQRDVPGRPELLGTTRDFLDYFGLRSLDELPPLAELKAMGDVNLQLDLAKEAAMPGGNPEGGPASADASNVEGNGEAAASGEAEQRESAELEAAGPELRAAEAFVADGEDASGADDDGGDEDELSASEPHGSSELVASPRNFDD